MCVCVCCIIPCGSKRLGECQFFASDLSSRVLPSRAVAMAPPLVSPQLDEGRVADLEEKSLMKMLSSMVESVEPPHFRPSVASTDLHPCARALEDASDLDGFLFQSIFDRDGSGLTALHVLAGASHLDSLRQVLDAGADPDLVGGIDLQRPLHIAVPRLRVAFSFLDPQITPPKHPFHVLFAF